MIKFFKNILLLILPLHVFSSEGDSIRSDKFQLGLLYSPELSYRTLKADAEYAWLKEAQDRMDIPRYGFSAGVYFGYRLSTRLALEIQALYSDKGSKIKENFMENHHLQDYWEKVPYQNHMIYHYNYLDIPVKLNYCLTSGKVKFYLAAGMSLNAFLNQKKKTYILYEDGSSKTFRTASTRGLEKMNFAILAGFGIGYQLSEGYQFKFEPVFKHSINSIVNAPVRNYLCSAGMQIGIAHCF
jgi:hypothetical protein